ncbi:IS66 family insertion sequence element accessory protein TnpA [Saprospira grandis]|uniref:IS66 family insertion sequence element accessory protein TnpA n=1 Tax=Saprospira grandis TaxID=1008 RepID=UPI00030772B5|nr:transposase [Saprospira grandis]
MPKNNFTKKQKLAILAEQDSGLSIADLCKKYQISSSTFYKWKRAKEEETDDKERLIKELEAQNARLKKMYADLSSNYEILEEGYAMAKKYSTQNDKKKS